MKAFLKITFISILTLIGLGLVGSCGSTNSLIPQSSVPLPEADGITVNPPDGNGLVLAQASENFLNSGDIMIGEVNPSGNAAQSYFVTNEDCETSIEECPSESICYKKVENNGSITLYIPANLGDFMRLYVRDPECVNSQALEFEVINEVQVFPPDQVPFDQPADPEPNDDQEDPEEDKGKEFADMTINEWLNMAEKVAFNDVVNGSLFIVVGLADEDASNDTNLDYYIAKADLGQGAAPLVNVYAFIANSGAQVHVQKDVLTGSGETSVDVISVNFKEDKKTYVFDVETLDLLEVLEE